MRSIKHQFQSLDKVLFYLDEFWNSEVAPYFIDSQTMINYNKYINGNNIPIVVVESIFNDKKYKNIVAMSSLLTKSYVQNQQELIRKIDQVLVMIEEIQ